MLAKHLFEETLEKMGQIIQESPIKDIEKNAKTAFTSALSRLDLVTREEFEMQQQMIEHLCNEINRLQNELDQLRES